MNNQDKTQQEYETRLNNTDVEYSENEMSTVKLDNHVIVEYYENDLRFPTLKIIHTMLI